MSNWDVKQISIIIKNKLLKYFTYSLLFSLFSKKSDQKDYRKYLFLQRYFLSIAIVKLEGIYNLFNV